MNIKLSTNKWQPALVLSIVSVLVPGAGPAQAAPPVATPINVTASIQTVSDTPAATLLVPYFEVDLSNPNGSNTIFTINNIGSLPNGAVLPTLTHVTIWSDLAVPVFSLSVYLTGYDVETIDMRQVLTGTLPQTASAGQDPGDTISPKGTKSADFNFASCNGILPPAPLTAAQITNLTTSLTGNPSPSQGGLCGGLNHNDNIARGYVTIDVVNQCTANNPGDAGYFVTGGTGTALNNNMLTGEVFYVNSAGQVAPRGVNLVHIHASPDPLYTQPGDPLVTTSGNYTFYGRLDGFTAADNRQPLATNFNARFNPGGKNPVPSTPWRHATATPTLLIVWRDPKVPQGYFTCGVLPAWYPLGQEGIVAFDEQERAEVATGIKPFPAATQIVQIGGSTLPESFGAGWLLLDLNTTVAGAAGPTGDMAAAQGWVDVVETGLKVMHRAQQADSATMANHSIP